MHRFTDLSIDIETLDITPTSVVLTIGAVAFDSRGQDASIHNAVFESPLLSIDEQLKAGRTVSGNTLLWWIKQNPAARNIFAAGQNPVQQELARFATFIRMHTTMDAKIWGNGADFDNVILKSLFESVGMGLPWNYQQNACYRTMLGLGLVEKEKLPARIGVFHSAVDDAMTQAVRLQAVMKCLVP